MTSSIQGYIRQIVRDDAKIKYDKSVKQWSGVLHHESGSMYAQNKSKTAVVKELEEVFEEFLVRFLEKKTAHQSVSQNRAKAYHSQISGPYLQA